MENDLDPSCFVAKRPIILFWLHVHQKTQSLCHPGFFCIKKRVTWCPRVEGVTQTSLGTESEFFSIRLIGFQGHKLCKLSGCISKRVLILSLIKLWSVLSQSESRVTGFYLLTCCPTHVQIIINIFVSRIISSLQNTNLLQMS